MLHFCFFLTSDAQHCRLIFEILPRLVDCRILGMGNTVEMTGGDINLKRQETKICFSWIAVKEQSL